MVYLLKDNQFYWSLNTEFTIILSWVWIFKLFPQSRSTPLTTSTGVSVCFRPSQYTATHCGGAVDQTERAASFTLCPALLESKGL